MILSDNLTLVNGFQYRIDKRILLNPKFLIPGKMKSDNVL